MKKPAVILAVVLAAFGCRGSSSPQEPLAADVPLHLEAYLDAARIEGSEVPKAMPEVAEWRFDEEQPGWKVAPPLEAESKPASAARVDDALRLTLTKETKDHHGFRQGYVYIDVPDWDKDDWGLVVVRARTKDGLDWIGLGYNLREKLGKKPEEKSRFLYSGDYANLIKDGEVHTYTLRTDQNIWPEDWKGPLKQLGLITGRSKKEEADTVKGPLSVDILSVSMIPKAMNYAKAGAGVGHETWGQATRSVIYMHLPGKIEYRVRVPEEGRLDFGFGLLRKDSAAKFRVSAREDAEGAERQILLEEGYSGKDPRVQRSVDLGRLAGKNVILTLETEAERPGEVAFWAAPTISGKKTVSRPNIIFYVIDGASADLMSVYGYNRRTTPNLEQLAAEGAVFENAHSNSSWTKISVPSFMTSLHGSVLGGFQIESDPLPEQAVTMAERMHRAGYMTEVLTSNPYCGRISSLDRGVDVMVDTKLDDVEDEVMWSTDLHREFWKTREAYPGEPYWVHFQPTDVHWPWRPVAPFEGLFAAPEERRDFEEMRKKVLGETGQDFEEMLEKSAIDHVHYAFISRKLYDESMARQDHAIGTLVGRLKDRGEWENTLFVVAADHGHDSGGLLLHDSKKPKYEAPLLAAHVSRIPMIFVWSGRIRPGRRFSQPVSMIDMLPTVLDLAGLPPLEIAQGQSLAPLLLGKPGWSPRPVVFDEFNIVENDYFGSIEVIDGRWGASLRIDPRPDDRKLARQRLRPAPLLVFDVWEDPQAFKSLHEARPDLVAKYSKMLEGIRKEHEALAKKFSRAANVPLTPAQIETLRSLGYLR